MTFNQSGQKVGVQINQADTLEMLLLQLAGMKERAQAIVAAEYNDDAGFDWDGDHKIWLGLEQNEFDGWGIGWLMRPTVAAEFVIEVSGRTPIEAALALRAKMGEVGHE